VRSRGVVDPGRDGTRLRLSVAEACSIAGADREPASDSARKRAQTLFLVERVDQLQLHLADGRDGEAPGALDRLTVFAENPPRVWALNSWTSHGPIQ
jgi:hypothetical protein